MRRRLDLLPDLGEALVESGDFEAARGRLAEAATLAEAVADARLAAHASIANLVLRRYAGEAGWGARVVGAADGAIAVFADAGDHAGLAKAYRLLCLAHGTACRFADFLAADELYLHHPLFSTALTCSVMASANPSPRATASLAVVSISSASSASGPCSAAIQSAT